MHDVWVDDDTRVHLPSLPCPFAHHFLLPLYCLRIKDSPVPRTHGRRIGGIYQDDDAPNLFRSVRKVCMPCLSSSPSYHGATPSSAARRSQHKRSMLHSPNGPVRRGSKPLTMPLVIGVLRRRATGDSHDGV